MEPLEKPPKTPEGDDSEAGGGAPANPVTEEELEDARELDDEDVEDENNVADV